jgi:hypothetical protein
MPSYYRIIVRGPIDQRWSAWFDGLTITPQPGGDTALSGSIQDQAALHGVLEKIRDLNLTLLSVEYTPTRHTRPSQDDSPLHPSIDEGTERGDG